MRSCTSKALRAAALAAALLFFALPVWADDVGALSPHHGVAGALIDRLYERIHALCPAPRRVVVIGPDHFHRAKRNIVLGASDWGTKNVLRGDDEGASLSHLPRQDEVAQRDHCITEHIPRIAKFFPNTSVLSVIVRHSATDLQVFRACRALEALLQDGYGIVILSMDLSHYKPREESDAEDERSLDIISGFRLSELNGADVDCPRGARLFLMLMKRLGLTHAELLERSNSADFVKGPADRTTGHATALFLKSALSDGGESDVVSENEFGFVDIADVIPDAIFDIRYYSTYNFVGERIDGYEEPRALMTREAAEALKAVADELRAEGYGLKIYDAYRPKTAVAHFVRWAKDTRDTRMKKHFYPKLNKSVLFKQGYIAGKSGHSRGSTVDLTLFDIKTGKDIDMGGTFDYFGKESHYDFKGITKAQRRNRKILRDAMTVHGFKPISTEWWHFTLKNEPYPDTYFDFPVK